MMSVKLSKAVTNERVRAPYHLTFCNQKSFKIIQQRAEEGNNNTANAHTTNEWTVDIAID